MWRRESWLPYSGDLEDYLFDKKYSGKDGGKTQLDPKNQGVMSYRNPLISLLAGATGIEPATSGVTGRRSNQLNYAPNS